jgi:hypothetical protein
VPRSGVTTWYVCWEMQTVTYPTNGCTLDVQAPRKASTDVPNMSNDVFNGVGVFSPIALPHCVWSAVWHYPIGSHCTVPVSCD